MAQADQDPTKAFRLADHQVAAANGLPVLGGAGALARSMVGDRQVGAVPAPWAGVVNWNLHNQMVKIAAVLETIW
jgi:hypothetical protein